jgi:uncharacterized protein YecE (DUF72 family)
MYYSAYDEEWIAALARQLAAAGPAVERWCVFDNTASGAALGDALSLRAKLEAQACGLQ